MSGAFGWHRNDQSHQSPTKVIDSGFKDAARVYQNPPAKAARIGPDSAPAPTPQTPPPAVSSSNQTRQSFQQVASSVHGPIPTATHRLTSTARNVLIVVTDVTGSMGDNPEEIFRRLPLMFEEACMLLGSRDLEVLFIAHGDARTDQHAVQVTRFGAGSELDLMLTSFSLSCGGGGQGSETPEIVAYYLLRQVDTSSAQNVYVWFVTDEAGCETLQPHLIRRWLELNLEPEYTQATTVFAALRRKMHIFVVLFDTGVYRHEPDKHNKIRPYWERVLGGVECVVPLDDARRIVDVMLGTIAVMTDQLALFTGALKSRQLPTNHGAHNVATVLQSIALVGRGTPSSPHVLKAKTRPLLPGQDND